MNVVNRLVELGASVNEKVNDGATPVHLGSFNGHLSVVDRLAELGAAVNEKDEDGRTPLHFACQFNHMSIIMLLLRHLALTTECSDDIDAIVASCRSRDALLAVLAYGFNQHVSDYVPQWRTSDLRSLFRVVCDMCSFQVTSPSNSIACMATREY